MFCYCNQYNADFRSFLTSILTAFETKDVNLCPHVYTGKNLIISAQGFSQIPIKQLIMSTFDFEWLFVIRLKRHNGVAAGKVHSLGGSSSNSVLRGAREQVVYA